MQFTGFADEAGPSIDTQIQATKAAGWSHLSARGVDGSNIHDLSEAEFDQCYGKLQDAGIQVAEIGSLIGTWAKSIHTDFDITLGEIERTIPRAKRLGTQLIRIMSYAQEPWGQDQHVPERIRRLKEISARLNDAGLIAAHENCMNYGGFSHLHTLELIDKVPDLKLIFDSGNPVFQPNRAAPPKADGSYPWQNALEFWQQVKAHVIHIHIKDCTNPRAEGEEPEYTYPGKGQADIPAILRDLDQQNYQGFLAIEPHVATVFHLEDDQEPDWQQCYDSYLRYAQEFEQLTHRIQTQS